MNKFFKEILFFKLKDDGFRREKVCSLFRKILKKTKFIKPHDVIIYDYLRINIISSFYKNKDKNETSLILKELKKGEEILSKIDNILIGFEKNQMNYDLKIISRDAYGCNINNINRFENYYQKMDKQTKLLLQKGIKSCTIFNLPIPQEFIDYIKVKNREKFYEHLFLPDFNEFYN